MEARSPSAPKITRLWREIIEGWLNLLTNPDWQSFKRHMGEASTGKTVLGVGFLGAVTGIWSITSNARLLPVAPHNLLAQFLLTLFLIEIAFYGMCWVSFIFARYFGGGAKFVEHAYILSLVTVPLGLFVVAFTFGSQKLGLTITAILNPLDGLNIALILMVLSGFYALLLLLFALQAAHKLSSKNAFYTLGYTAGILGLFRSFAVSPTFQENILVQLINFMIQQWQGGLLQAAILGHFWLIFFAVAVAVIIGVIMGILISLSPQRPQIVHVFFLLPIGLFFLLWAFSSGLFGEQLAAQISDTVRQWQRAMRGGEGAFGPLLSIFGAIVRKPAAIGVLGMAITLIFYVLLLVGERASDITLYIAGIILTIPSIAMFGILIEPLGIGGFNAAFALILYAQLPILRNTYTGIREVEPEIVEAGRGMGMTELQLLRQVRFPLAVPVIFTGVRVSIVMLVGIAAIAAYIGVHTLGDYIFTGISRAQELRYLTGAIVVALLALVVDYALEKLEALLTPEGLRGRQEAGRQAA